MSLTKNTDKLLCSIYKEYLIRVKSGTSKQQAKEFTDRFDKEILLLSSWKDEDIENSLAELRNNDYISQDILGNISLKNKAIINMENRFKELIEVTDL